MADEVLFNPQTRQYGQRQEDGSVKILDPGQLSPEILAKYTPDLALTLRQSVEHAVRTGDMILSAARKGTGEMLKAGGQAIPGAELLNPVPGSVADAAAMAATLPIRGGVVSGLAKRALAAGTAGGAVTAAKGEDPFSAALGYAGTQAGMEVPFAALGLALNARALSQAKQKVAQAGAFNDAMAQTLTEVEKKQYLLDKQAMVSKYAEDLRTARFEHKAKGQQAKMDWEAQMATQRATYEKLAAAHSEQGATLIADDFKKSVPAWADFPSSTKGLVDMVYGKGQEVASKAYDVALKAAMGTAKGSILVSQADALALGVTPEGIINISGKGGQQIPMAVLPADQAIKNTVGLWSKDASAYRRVVNALEKAGVGVDPAERAAYKASQAIIQFSDKSQMLAKGVYEPEKALAGLTKLRNLTELRGRGQGDVFRGSVAESVRGRPQPPTETPTPVTPPFPGIQRPTLPTAPTARQPLKANLPPGFTTRTIPAGLKEHPFIVGAGTQVLASPFDLPFGTPFATGALVGWGLGGRGVTTDAPRGAIGKLLLQVPPTLLREMGFGEE